MGKTSRGTRDGTGPHKDSFQKTQSNTGKRVNQGKKCPVKSK